MKIHIIAEENDGIKSIDHEDIGDFFIFGNKKDGDGSFVNFHDWKGSYRYLIGSLSHFLNEVELEQLHQTIQVTVEEAIEKALEGRGKSARSSTPPNIHLASPAAEGADHPGIIKTIEAPPHLQVVEIDPKAVETVDVENTDDAEEMVVEEARPEPSIQAEDS